MDYVDLYCERTGPGLWGEPFNAVTNLAFLFAAWLCWTRFGRKGADMDRSGALILSLVAVIGAGSALLHTFATRWALWADVIPITVFVHTFLFFALKRFFKARTPWAAALTGAFALVANGAPLLVDYAVLNGSVTYLAPLTGLFAMGTGMWRLRIPQGTALMAAAGVFAAALTLRTIDLDVCQDLPTGTHFLWHMLNGVALYLVGRAYLLSYSSSSSNASGRVSAS